ncbi:hypothetical protein EDB85DRAFT_2283292, partial [Lactarius pseudohatsudake]
MTPHRRARCRAHTAHPSRDVPTPILDVLTLSPSPAGVCPCSPPSPPRNCANSLPSTIRPCPPSLLGPPTPMTHLHVVPPRYQKIVSPTPNTSQTGHISLSLPLTQIPKMRIRSYVFILFLFFFFSRSSLTGAGHRTVAASSSPSQRPPPTTTSHHLYASRHASTQLASLPLAHVYAGCCRYLDCHHLDLPLPQPQHTRTCCPSTPPPRYGYDTLDPTDLAMTTTSTLLRHFHQRRAPRPAPAPSRLDVAPT